MLTEFIGEVTKLKSSRDGNIMIDTSSPPSVRFTGFRSISAKALNGICERHHMHYSMLWSDGMNELELRCYPIEILDTAMTSLEGSSLEETIVATWGWKRMESMRSNKVRADLYRPHSQPTTLHMIQSLFGRVSVADVEFTPQGWWVTEYEKECKLLSRKIKEPERFVPKTRTANWVHRAGKRSQRPPK